MPYILIVDEDKDLLKIVKSFLQMNGLEVHGFTDWENAAKRIKKYKPQLILLDVFLNRD